MTKLRSVLAGYRARFDAAGADAEDGMEVLQSVILAAGLGAAAVLIVAAISGAIDSWISKLPL